MRTPDAPEPHDARGIEITIARTPGDFEAVAGLMREYVAWDAERTRALGYDADAFLEFYYGAEEPLPGEFAPPLGCLLLARRDGAPAACGGLRPLGANEGELKRLFVRPTHRGLGLGRSIAERLIAYAAAAGHRVVRLETVSFMADAHALYASLGFEPCAPYYDIPDSLRPITRFLARRLP